MSHKESPERGGQLHAISLTKKAISELVGVEVPMCPWRAFRDPLVMTVLDLIPAWDQSSLGAFVGDDPPLLWLDAVKEYAVARDRCAAEFKRARIEREKRERSRSRGRPR